MSNAVESNAKITVHRFADPDVTLFDPVSEFIYSLMEVSVYHKIGMRPANDGDKL